MEKIFTFNKWFVLFCGLLVLMWLALQTVATMRLEELAAEEAKHVFSWQWLGFGRSRGVIEKAHLIKKSEADAIVRVTARQVVEAEAEPGHFQSKGPEVTASALLTFYRVDKDWLLGKVDFE
jgi:hypothetical protein